MYIFFILYHININNFYIYKETSKQILLKYYYNKNEIVMY